MARPIRNIKVVPICLCLTAQQRFGRIYLCIMYYIFQLVKGCVRSAAMVCFHDLNVVFN